MNTRSAFAAIFAALFLLLFCSMLLPVSSAPVTAIPGMTTAGTALWMNRTFEVILQGFIILAGVVSILLLVVENRQEKTS